MKLFFRRAGAYILDVLLVSLLVSLLSWVSFLNPNREQYKEKYNELIMVEEQFEKKEMSIDELEQAYIPIAYDIYRLNIYYVIIDIVCVLLYFGVFQYFMNGQTLGKKLFKIRIVNKDNGKLTLLNSMLRTIVLSNVLISIALQSIVYICNVENYYTIYNNVNLVGTIILYTSLFLIIVRQDGRGLHDLVGGTKVISEEPKTQNDPIIDVEVEEPKKNEPQKEIEIKKKKSSSKTTKTKKKGNTKAN